MKKIAPAATIEAFLGTAAQAAEPTLYPHAYSTRITGASPAVLSTRVLTRVA